MSRRAERIACMALSIALAPATGCGGGENPARNTPKRAADVLAVVGAYTQVLRFTPKGPGYAGEGRAVGEDRYEFGRDYRQECPAPATYALRTRGERVAFEAVGADPCALRREVLTSKTWARARMP